MNILRMPLCVSPLALLWLIFRLKSNFRSDISAW